MPAENNPLETFLVNASEIKESTRRVTSLRASEIRYRRLFEAARDGILILNAGSLEITDANPFMTELLGYSHAEFLGKELWEIGLFNDREASQKVFRELQKTRYIRYEDLPLQTKHGARREVEFISNVYVEDDHEVIQCNIRDMTEHKQAGEARRLLLQSEQEARAEADAANTMKDEFLGTLSHELRTPLTSILGWSQLLCSGSLDRVESERGMEIIARNARAQKQLIDDLLDISRIVTGKLRLIVRPVNLTPLIQAVVEGVRPAADARNIDLHIAPDSRIIEISADPDRLQQITWNLLTNAIKFTPKGGRVEVKLKRNDSNVEIIISDTGQGIAPELLGHIFERFRQADSSITRRHAGLGLGLSIVRQLVELHGGTVAVESPGEGRGSIFTVTLPLLSVHQKTAVVDLVPATAAKALTDWQPSLRELRVLVVDDELDTRELIIAVLTGRGAEVVSVDSGAEALAEIERGPFDVLVLDIGMPIMDGYALIEKIRQLTAERERRIPAVALTAYAGVQDQRRALSSGYQLHISKPVEPDELARAVANLAGRHPVRE